MCEATTREVAIRDAMTRTDDLSVVVYVDQCSAEEMERDYLARHARWSRIMRGKRRSRHDWTDKEKDALREHYPRHRLYPASIRDLSPNAIRHMARSLGLIVKVPWTDEEKWTLTSMWRMVGNAKLRKALPGRKWKAITKMAEKLSLTGKLKLGVYSPSGAAKLVGISKSTMANILHRAGVKLRSRKNFNVAAGTKTHGLAMSDEIARAYAIWAAPENLEARARIEAATLKIFAEDTEWRRLKIEARTSSPA